MSQCFCFCSAHGALLFLYPCYGYHNLVKERATHWHQNPRSYKVYVPVISIISRVEVMFLCSFGLNNIVMKLCFRHFGSRTLYHINIGLVYDTFTL